MVVRVWPSTATQFWRPEQEQECWLHVGFVLFPFHPTWVPSTWEGAPLCRPGPPPPTSPLWKPSMLHHLPGDFKTSKIDLDNQPTHWAYWFLIRVTQVWPGVCPSKTGVSRPQTVTGDTCTLLCREGGGLCSLLTPSTDSKPRVLSSNLDFATDRSDLEKMATNASDLKENPPCPSA